MAQRAQRLYQAQETRWRREKILTARAQYSRSTAPWEVYDSLFANGYAWNTLADDGRYAPELALLSTRAIFGLWALWDTRYTDALMQLGRLHQDEKRGWFEGRYEANGGYNATFTLTTNTVVLEALLFKQNRGPLLQAPLNDGYLGVRMKDVFNWPGTVCRRSVYRSPARKEDDMGINYEELFNNSYSRITQGDKGDRFFTHFMRCLSAAPKTLARRAASLSGWKNRKSFIKPFSTCSRSPIPISWRITWCR